MTARMLSRLLLISTATRSTRGVSTLSTVTSPNWRAEEISSPCCSSRLPSSVMSSMMSYSSSSVKDTGVSSGVSFAADWPIQVSRAERGVKTFIRNCSTGPVARASGSLYFLAMLLGSISPAKKTTIVVTMVLIDTALRPHIFVTATVTMEAVAICTILVQISKVLMALSKSSRINSAVFALASPRSAAAFTRLLGQEA